MDDNAAKKYLLILTALKLSGSLIIIGGLFLLMQPQRFGLDQVTGSVAGAIIMLAGLAELVIAPKLMRRHFQDQEKK